MDTIKQIETEAKKYFRDAGPCHDWSHVQRVYNLCMRMSKEMGANLDVLRLAVLLHDIARREESLSKGEICHAEKSAKIAKEVLQRHGVDKEVIDQVIHCIETHRFRNKDKPKTIEAKILFDADKLDSIGAIGIGRAYSFSGEHGGMLYNLEDNMGKEYTKDDTPLREFAIKLSKIKDNMLTVEGKKIAKERHHFMIQFFDRLKREAEGKS